MERMSAEGAGLVIRHSRGSMTGMGRPLPVTTGRFQEANSTDCFPAMNPNR
jgi:hypothetical protein